MPLTYRIDHELKLVVTTGSGDVTFDELRNHRNQLSPDPRVDGDFAELMDLIEIVTLRLTLDELGRLIALDGAPGYGTSPLAVVSEKPAVYGVFRMYSMRSERSGRQVGVFTTVEEALVWIKASRDSTSPEA